MSVAAPSLASGTMPYHTTPFVGFLRFVIRFRVYRILQYLVTTIGLAPKLGRGNHSEFRTSAFLRLLGICVDLGKVPAYQLMIWMCMWCPGRVFGVLGRALGPGIWSRMLGIMPGTLKLYKTIPYETLNL